MSADPQLLELASRLGISEKQLDKLRIKYPTDEALTRRLKRWIEETRDRPKLLGKTGGYTERPGFALRVVVRTEVGTEAEPEAVDDVTQKRLTREARERGIQATAQVIAAAEDVMAAIQERAEQSPDFKREARLTLHRMRRELDRFVSRQKRKVA